MNETVIQVFSLLGSLLVLGAFIAAQAGKTSTTNRVYIALNFVGSGIMALIAIIEQQWGFLLLEGVWSLVSLWSLVRLLRGKSVVAGH